MFLVSELSLVVAFDASELKHSSNLNLTLSPQPLFNIDLLFFDYNKLFSRTFREEDSFLDGEDEYFLGFLKVKTLKLLLDSSIDRFLFIKLCIKSNFLCLL